MSNVITFYDIPSTLPGVAWSPNTWKARFSLNFKGIPYKTEWVEYPDIEGVMKKIGAPPTAKKPDGSPLYTLPAIYDPSTGAAVAESILIAEYLDATYPNTPKLFPNGTAGLQTAFVDAYLATLSSLWQYALTSTNKYLNPPSEAYFRPTREARIGKKFVDAIPKGQQHEEEWGKVRAAFSVADGWLQKGKANGPYFLGNTPVFADFVIGSMILWIKKVIGEDSAEWKDIQSWNEGRWVVFMKGIEKYESTAQ